MRFILDRIIGLRCEILDLNRQIIGLRCLNIELKSAGEIG